MTTRVSFSQYAKWLNCPWQWKLEYVDGFKPEEKSIDLIFGTTMHEVIQDWLKDYFYSNRKFKNIDLNYVLKKTLKKNFLEEVIVNEDDIKIYPCDVSTYLEYYKDGCEILDHVQRYAKDFFPTKNCELLGCEIAIEDLEVKSGVNVVCYLDIVIVDKDENLIYIFDLKTSKDGWNIYKKKDPKKVDQILLYKKFYSEKFGVPMENIIPRFIILKRKINENSDYPVKRLAKFEPSHGKGSLKKVEESWNQFLNTSFDESGNVKLDNLQATPSKWNCNFCPFKNRKDLCEWGIGDE